MAYAYRDLVPGDASFLLEMLRLALGWHLVPPYDGSPLPVPVPARVFFDLGRPGDGGVVATYDGEPVGACWYRLVPTGAAGRRSEDDDVPELTLAVLPAHRLRGVGGALLDRGIAHARAAGFPAVALTVEAGNPARGMYERRGFAPVDDALPPRHMRKDLLA